MSAPEQQPQTSIYQEITEKIRSGEYYKDAVDWYAIKFIQPVTHRSFLILVTLISVLLSTWSLIILGGILPRVEVLPIITNNSDMSKYYLELHQIGNPLTRPARTDVIYASSAKENPNMTVIRALVGKYIQMREDYDFDKLKTDFAYVKNFSSDGEYAKFVSLMKPETPNSPILVYRNHTKRYVTVDKVAVLPRGENSTLPANQHRVVATFTATEDGPASSGEKTAWKATLDVRSSDVVFYKDKEEFSPIDFMVTRYEVEQLKAR